MPINIIRLNDQANGQFDGGKIRENKPIGFRGEGGKLRPYSNLFYWAHAWSDEGGLIDTHPHQAFEILSFVLEGEISHYDTKNDKWKKLKKGDVQIIRAGNGISHAERIYPGGEIFQIWFDPDISKSIFKPASYDDYPSKMFKVTTENGLSVKTYKGNGAAIKMDSEKVEIREMSLNIGTHQLKLNKDMQYSCYVIEGSLKIADDKFQKKDYFVISDDEFLEIDAIKKTRLFMIGSPKRPSYATYYERHGR